MPHPTEVAIVTGGAGGIGEAAARAIGRRGVRVAIADLRLPAAEAAAARLRAEGLEVEPVAVDVGSETCARAMAETVLARWGRIDILVNNAGVESSKPFLEIGLEEYERVMRVNTTGVWLCCQAVIPAMLRQHRERQLRGRPAWRRPARDDRLFDLEGCGDRDDQGARP
jgi:3-oxoacyl-[acyl-carrier protein] reductase